MRRLELRTFLSSVTACALIASPATAKDWRFGDGVTPERWSLVNSAYALCDAGPMQPPIDLGAANAHGDIQIDVNFAATTGTIALGGDTARSLQPKGNRLVVAPAR